MQNKKPLTRGIQKCGRKGKNKDRYRMYALQILRYMPRRYMPRRSLINTPNQNIKTSYTTKFSYTTKVL